MKFQIKKIKLINFIPIIIFAIISNLSLNGCGGKDNSSLETDTHLEETGHEDEHTDEVALTEEQLRVMEIQLSRYEKQNISGYIKANGEIMINPDNESKVGGIIPGRVKKIYVKEGSFVRAGQTLAVIENPDLINVQVDYINAKNEYEFAKQEYERQRTLSSDNIGSKKNLAEVESNYKRALANYKTLEEKLSTYKISKNRFNNIYQDTIANLQRNFSITAPISGNVVSRLITIGQYVEPSMDMFHIVNTTNVFVDLSIFEKDLPYVSIGQKVELETTVNPNESYTGTVSYINKVFDDKNRTVKVRVSIDNRSQKLLPFMFVTARIYINDGSVMAVPVSAIETEGESKYIFVKTSETREIETHSEHAGEEAEHKEEEHKEAEHNEEEHSEKEGDAEKHEEEKGMVFKKVLVNTGISDDKFIEIFPLEPLMEGTEVVSKGTFYMKSEIKKDELGEHEH